MCDLPILQKVRKCKVVQLLTVKDQADIKSLVHVDQTNILISSLKNKTMLDFLLYC